jgi:hypothetical protein
MNAEEIIDAEEADALNNSLAQKTKQPILWIPGSLWSPGIISQLPTTASQITQSIYVDNNLIENIYSSS